MPSACRTRAETRALVRIVERRDPRVSSFSCHFVSPQTLSPASNAGTCLQLGTAGCLLGVGIFIYFAASATRVAAQPLEGWTTVTDADSRLEMQYPAGVFSVRAGPTEPIPMGRRSSHTIRLRTTAVTRLQAIFDAFWF